VDVLVMAQTILTLNAGSSSLKYGLFTMNRSPTRLASGVIDRLGADPSGHARALEQVLARIEPHGGLDQVRAIGHRVVHGGPRFVAPCVVTPQVLEELRRLCDLDPDHLPAEISVIEAMATRASGVPNVACFDTAFHAAMPRVAKLLPIPRRYEAAGLRRYGFHGLSYAYLLEELERLAGQAAASGRVVLAHLGSGASLAAVRDGRPVDTTMGFTPTSGIPMGTRSGDLDPGVLLYVLRTEKLGAEALSELLNRRSGLVGISETSDDMRDLLDREASDPRAADAVNLFCYRARQAIGALAATLGGIETLVFAGGIGENSSPVRERIAEGLGHLGVHLDLERNREGGGIISAPASPCVVRVIKTDEEVIVARQTFGALQGAGRAMPEPP
jgi:acetate kinase